ncbi:MAG: GtrA family protein [Rhizomicrobium sp.]
MSAFLRFGLVGAAGFVVNEAALWVALHLLHFGRDVSWFVAFLPSVTFTWWGNRTFTFREHASTGAKAMLREWAHFVVTNSFGALVNFGVYELLIHFTAVGPLLALACGVLAGMMFNFTLSKRLVFRPK